MKFQKELYQTIVEKNVSTDTLEWLQNKLETIVGEQSTKDFYLTYTLLATKASREKISVLGQSELKKYMLVQEMTQLELLRVYLMRHVLLSDAGYFESKVAQLAQLADTTELQTFLKYLIFLPDPAVFLSVGVEALRSNILGVFNAIALHNPYPAEYFNEQQWNQMYLKAVFIETDLQHIVKIDERANADLARIISDYAHERWAASRTINPLFWRPVSKFMNETLLADMQRLLKSTDAQEQLAGALCCFYSGHPVAIEMLKPYEALHQKIKKGFLNWESLNY